MPFELKELRKGQKKRKSPLGEQAQEMKDWRLSQMLSRMDMASGIDRGFKCVYNIELGYCPPSPKTYRNYLLFRAKIERKLQRLETIAKDGGPKWEQ